jgi:uncharacterized protein (DUF427 family)
MQRIQPGPGQESVWDYPRPPRIEPAADAIRVEFGGQVVAQSTRALRVLETSHPPVYYVPLEDVDPGVLKASSSSTFCEFKGRASYYSLRVGDRRSPDAAWTYRTPAPGYEALTDMVAFYPGRVDACYVGDERVTPQEGDFYGGWITSGIVGPFKGGPGTRGW